MFNIFHLARGAFAGIRPLKNGRMKEELSLLLSELSFPVLYLKSVISVDLFGLPQSDLCFQEKAGPYSTNLSASLQNKCVS